VCAPSGGTRRSPPRKIVHCGLIGLEPRNKRAAPTIGLPSCFDIMAPLRVYLGQIRQGLFDILVRVQFDILELTVQEGVVGRQVEMAVAG
jgi:hypothetical protein